MLPGCFRGLPMGWSWVFSFSHAALEEASRRALHALQLPVEVLADWKPMPLIHQGLAIVALAYVLAIVIRFALSRRREFMADAGAVELTKNPDAMIRALQKISAAPEIAKAPKELRAMFLYDRETGFAGLMATHPPIEARIEALVRYGGGRAEPPSGSVPAV